MSAWLVSDVHLSAMVQSAVVEGVITFDEADDIWQQAKFQNLWALHCRYGDAMLVMVEADHGIIEEYPVKTHGDVPLNRTTIESPLRPDVVERCIDCWMYQCAEFTDWDLTPVSLLFKQLVSVLHERHPDVDWDADDRGGWGILNWSEVKTLPTTRHLHLVDRILPTTEETP